MFGVYFNGNSATRTEISGYPRPFRGADLDQIIEDEIGDFFMERAVVSVTEEIDFQGFAFHAFFIGDVVDGHVAEIGLTGNRAEGGEFRAVKGNDVGPIRVGIGKGFESGVCGAERHRGFAGREEA